MSTITDLLGKILGSEEAKKIVPSLTGLLGNGSNNFTDSCKQIFGLFEKISVTYAVILMLKKY